MHSILATGDGYFFMRFRGKCLKASCPLIDSRGAFLYCTEGTLLLWANNTRNQRVSRNQRVAARTWIPLRSMQATGLTSEASRRSASRPQRVVANTSDRNVNARRYNDWSARCTYYLAPTLTWQLKGGEDGLDHKSARGTYWECGRPARTRARGPRSQEAGRGYDQGPLRAAD